MCGVRAGVSAPSGIFVFRNRSKFTQCRCVRDMTSAMGSSSSTDSGNSFEYTTCAPATTGERVRVAQY